MIFRRSRRRRYEKMSDEQLKNLNRKLQSKSTPYQWTPERFDVCKEMAKRTAKLFDKCK